MEAFVDAVDVDLLAFFADFFGAAASTGSATDSAALRFGILRQLGRKTMMSKWIK